MAIRNAVYVLPDSPQAREDFEWMRAEIMASKGEASVFAAETIDSLTRDDIIAAFRADREGGYKAIVDAAGRLTGPGFDARTVRGIERQRIDRAAGKLRAQLSQVVASDFFGAAGRSEAEAALARLERLLAAPAAETGGRRERPVLRPADYRGRTWITRPRPGIDRCGSAWLIRRFIDPDARFAFGDNAGGAPRAVPFDMYDVEFSHRGDRCTFEVLLERFGIDDPAAVRLGRLVHDLDLKETRYKVPEAAAVGRLIDGLRQAQARDGNLLEHGMTMFEALYRSYSSGRPAPLPARPGRSKRTSVGRKGREKP